MKHFCVLGPFACALSVWVWTYSLEVVSIFVLLSRLLGCGRVSMLCLFGVFAGVCLFREYLFGFLHS